MRACPHVRDTGVLLRLLAAIVVLVAAQPSLALSPNSPRAPKAMADELLAADRAFSAISAKTLLASGLSAQFADEVVMPVPGKGFAHGKAAAIAALAEHPDSADARIEWSPVRVGISADGRDGFTFGTMVLTRADDSEVPLKYLAYWRRGDDGWRVLAYKRSRRPADAVGAPAMMAPALPPRLVVAEPDAATRARHERSLDRAERAFSDDAQRIGLAAAFERHGRADAINLGGPDVDAFVVGNRAIGRAVSSGEPATGSSVAWAPDRVIVADSGDLGVTIGMIRPHAQSADGRRTEIPFFTVWRRTSIDQPWRYIAE